MIWTLISISLLICFSGLVYFFVKKNFSLKKDLEKQNGELNELSSDLSLKDSQISSANLQNQGLKEHIDKLNSHIKSLNDYYSYLQQFKPIYDIDVEVKRRWAEFTEKQSKAEAEQIREFQERMISQTAELDRVKFQAQTAQSRADTLISNAEQDIERRWQEYLIKEETAKVEAKSSLENEKIKLNEKLQNINSLIEKRTEEASKIIGLANDQSASILESANVKATEIAGDAWEAKQNAEYYKETLGALERRIKGYGDEWIVPSSSILDDLADEYSFDEAGQNLKTFRKYSNILCAEGKAADCLYVEKNRRETAIRFVTDAFNGAVDSIFSKIKHDNYGRLKKQVEDAFKLVNLNGKAFREAKVTDEYLQSRLNELEWGVKAHALKLRDKEEQRKAKELLREEARAKKEYEKAIRDALREEQKIENEISKATKALAEAHENERVKYEKELEELRQKWEEAESRNQRAVAMAQLTKRGHVYIISNIGSFGENIYKIGMTRRLDPMDRVKELGDASVPFEFDVHAIIFSEDAPSLESKLHEAFKNDRVNKVNLRKEFFRTKIEEIIEVTQTEELECKWTLKAKAAHYRESLELSKRSVQAN